MSRECGNCTRYQRDGVCVRKGRKTHKEKAACADYREINSFQAIKANRTTYERILNKYPIGSDLKINGGRYTGKKAYGTWLRINDKEMFELGYRNWLEQIKKARGKDEKRT